MQYKYRNMEFIFEGNHYRANMTANGLYGNGRAGSPGFNIPIKLPDDRFVQVYEWMESYPPKAGGFVIISGDGITNHATAELITEK